jgi:endonuclease/exonuclease/phosphatase family metal-dependent hydrolase
MATFKLVTFNLLNKPSRWHKRRELIVSQLRQLQPDAIALQEVALPHNTAHWIADQLGGYSVHTSPKSGALAEHEAVATLSRLPVTDCKRLDLATQSRVAQAVTLQIGGRDIVLVNGHFMFHVYDHVKRIRQVERVLTLLRLTTGALPTIVCGDFNATPDMRSIQMMKERFTSAHEAKHGREPEWTCPTPLHYHLNNVRKGLSTVGNLIAYRQPEPWRGTVDYIFVDENFTVGACDVVLDQPAPDDPTLYPSDHVGLCAELVLSGSARSL